MARTKQTARGVVNTTKPLCGCWFPFANPINHYHIQRLYLPLVGLSSLTTILPMASRTTMTQTFVNNRDEDLTEIIYSFPLYHDVSVVSFNATVGDIKIHGVVKEQTEARQEYKQAMAKGEAAGLLEQLPEASDVFVTKIGNVPAGQTVVVELVFVGELKYDAEANGTRFTLPATVAPRYGSTPHDMLSSQLLSPHISNGIEITVNIQGNPSSRIRQIQSPSHPIKVTMGQMSEMAEDTFQAHQASATLSLNTTVFSKDFVLVVTADDDNASYALLETHPTIPSQRALMATVIPQFMLPPNRGELVFIIDRSGSMTGKMEMVITAMKIMIKSLAVGTMFNVCSFGSHFSFLWDRSRPYTQSNSAEALRHIDEFKADYGGTEILSSVKATVEARSKDLTLDVILLTDGDIWQQDALFNYISERAKEHACRFFALGIGSGVSTSLVEGVAKAGNGFCQFVSNDEKMDRKMVRLLKGAMSPRIKDCTLEITYADNDEYVMVEPVCVASSTEHNLPVRTRRTPPQSAPVPLSVDADRLDEHAGDSSLWDTAQATYAHLPQINHPSAIQAPSQLPMFYLFTRASVYFLLQPQTYHKSPESVIFRGSSDHGPLELEIKVQDMGLGQTIHQLATKKAISDLENSGGWLANAEVKTQELSPQSIDKLDPRWNDVVKREAVDLGVKYQVGGKWCSFIAIQRNNGQEVEEGEVSFGGRIPQRPALVAPRRQLASKAARKSAPSAGCVRHRKILLHKAPRKSARSAITPGAKERQVTQGGTAVSNVSRSSVHRSISQLQHRYGTRSKSMLSNSIDDSDKISGLMDVDEKEESQAQQKADVEEKMLALVHLQNFDGSWSWGNELLRIFECNKLRGVNRSEKNSTLATALTVAFFRFHTNGIGTWELIVDKGLAWLTQQAGFDVEKEVAAAKITLFST